MKIAKKPTFDASIAISVPGSDKKENIDLTFVYKTKSEYADFNKENEKAKIDDILPKLITKWRGVEDESGKELEYNESNLKTLLDVFPAASMEIYQAYGAELFGVRVKN